MTAPARVTRSAGAYLRLSRKLTSVRTGQLQRRHAGQHQTPRRRLGLRRVHHRGQRERTGTLEKPRVAGDLGPVRHPHLGMSGGLSEVTSSGSAQACRDLRRPVSRSARRAPPRRDRLHVEHRDPVGGDDNRGLHLVQLGHHLRRDVVIRQIERRLRAVQHQVHAAGGRDLLHHQAQRPLDLRQRVLAGLLDDAVAFGEFAPRGGDAVLQLALLAADLLGATSCRGRSPAPGRDRAAWSAPSGRPRSASAAGC